MHGTAVAHKGEHPVPPNGAQSTGTIALAEIVSRGTGGRALAASRSAITVAPAEWAHVCRTRHAFWEDSACKCMHISMDIVAPAEMRATTCTRHDMGV